MAANPLLASRLRQPRTASMTREDTLDEMLKKRATDAPDTFPNSSNTLDLLDALNGGNSSGASSGSSSPGGSNAMDVLRMRNMSGNGSGAGAGNLSFGQEGAFTGQQGQGWNAGGFTPAATGLGGGLMAVPGTSMLGTAGGGAAHSAGVMSVPGGLSNAAVGSGAGGASGGAAGGAGGAAGIGALGAAAWLAAPIAFVAAMRMKRHADKKEEGKREEAFMSTLTPEEREKHYSPEERARRNAADEAHRKKIAEETALAELLRQGE